MRKQILKTSLGIAALLLIGFIPRVSAQIDSVVINSVGDTVNTTCATPATLSFGWASFTYGTIPPDDSIIVYTNFGDGTDTTYKLPTQGVNSDIMVHDYLTTGTFQASVTITTSNSFVATLIGQPHTITNTCATIAGRAYVDADADCIYDIGELPVAGKQMFITNTTTGIPYYAYTDNNGNYAVSVPPGAVYDVRLMPDPISSLAPSCPVSGVASMNVTGMGPYTNDMGYNCMSMPSTDFEVAGFASCFRPGYDRQIYVYANSNNYCAAYPATVVLTLDPQLTYSSTALGVAPSSIAGNVITWNVSSLSMLTDLSSVINVMCDTGATAGDTLCNTLYVFSTAVTDSNQTNDTLEICAEITNSFDPNEKQVTPDGGIAAGTTLTYLVNFQNTGNDTAYNITIVDTLSDNIEMTSVEFIESSHPAQVDIVPGNVMKFRFENIMLPDSNTNEPASHGFVMYRATAKHTLPLNSTVENTAHIYFDFNPAIVTNTTINTIISPSYINDVQAGVSATIYPNPASQVLNITVEGMESFDIMLTDMTGRIINTKKTTVSNATVDVRSLSTGTYILNLKNGAKVLTAKVTVLR